MLGGRVPELPAQLELDKHVIGSHAAGVGDVGHRDAAGKRSRRASGGWWWGVGGGWAGGGTVLTSSGRSGNLSAVWGPEELVTGAGPPWLGQSQC